MAAHRSQMEAFATLGMVETMMLQNSIPFLNLYVSRENLVHDTLAQLHNVPFKEHFKKPLKVEFLGEQAEDAGGVRKEFFLLLLKELLDPKYGMFKSYEETRTIWFDPKSFEEDSMFYLIGITCGLAIYNHTIINLPFPLALYKKLLGTKKKLGIEDLAQLSPSTAKGLKDLLEYEGDDVEDVFCLDFTATVSFFGESETRPLKKDGHKIAVTNQNKIEYVDLYCDFILNESVKDKFRAFERGFSDVCLGPVMELFHPHELMALVVGNENYDWNELEANAEYLNMLRSLSDILKSASILGVEPELWKSQNLFFEYSKKFHEGQFEFPDEEWEDAFVKLGEMLNMRPGPS